MNVQRYAERIWKLERNLVSEGIDIALRILSEWLPLEISSYPSGSEAFTWIVPKKWTCVEAKLLDMRGNVLISAADHPLHCLIYSQSFNGIVTNRELKKHLFSQPEIPSAVPFRFSYYRDNWGLCCSHNLVKSLNDEFYRVIINTSHEDGHLRVGEYYIPGHTEEEFIFVAHLCHPHQFNDDLSGVLLGMRIMEELQKRKNKYSYRLLIVPETIGSICWISRNEQILERCIGGCFLEMTATHEQIALQQSLKGSSIVDYAFMKALQMYPESITGSFREIVGNDEKQFNAPGVGKPFVSVSRARPESGRSTRHFPFYHTDQDTLDYACWDNFYETYRYIMESIKILEEDKIPLPLFKCEPFMTRFDLFYDKYDSPRMNQLVFDVIYQLDGSKSVGVIAESLGENTETVMELIVKMEKVGLVRLK